MDREPEYVGVTTNKDGEVALCLIYEGGDEQYIYLDQQDLCNLLASVMLLLGDDNCQTYH